MCPWGALGALAENVLFFFGVGQGVTEKRQKIDASM